MLINQYIDHTLLKPTATINDIKKHCQEAIKYHFYAVCVNECYVTLARNYLGESPVKVVATVGFPLGAMAAETKVIQAKNCILRGASEIDMVVNLGYIKSGLLDAVEKEIASIKKAIGNHVLKVIIETSYLTDEEKRLVTNLAIKAGADYIKTSTGFGTVPVTLDDIVLLKEVTTNKIKIKASGGIRDALTAKQFIQAGVHRLGTSSSIAIVTQKQ
ncbi:deoxyribose-phosphate aldolase [Dokdonia pacifica]|uniref:Deoxyribose-phosphate aldolase n=1 Tax=Dokdonia pacifica TaxID=1627892 RepID=A0A239BI50_9FLAO|nr:deoxyribose-phosphate aldolase [Dokdonia pacifica]GGG29438.1 deoxyribose-phosphate aldolase [Dokdonia pacifica]SNS07252.1 deoxyribose-phosphate aldolase [Dokdonia pacifica]